VGIATISLSERRVAQVIFDFVSLAAGAMFGDSFIHIRGHFFIDCEPIGSEFSEVMLPFTTGGFIYIAGSDSLPEFHKETKVRKSILQFAAVVCGVALMYLLTFLE